MVILTLASSNLFKAMLRSFSTFLFFFIFSQLAAQAEFGKKVEDILALREVTVDMSTQIITLSWFFNDNAEGKPFKIYRCIQNCEFDDYHECYEVIMHRDTLTWTDTAMSTTRNFYSIGSYESGKSAPMNNMVLKARSITDSCKNTAFLSWNPYIYYLECDWFGGVISGSLDVVDYYIYYRNDVATPFILLDSVMGIHFSKIDSKDSVYYQAKFLENIEYEFVVQAICKSDTMRPFSNIVRFITGYDVDISPVPIDISSVSVVHDEYIEISVNTGDFSYPFERLILYRDNKDSLSFQAIDTLSYKLSNPYIFNDYNADPHTGLYYFMTVAENKCKANDTSNVLTNIYLTGGRIENYKDTLAYIQVSLPETNTFEYYELFRVINNKEFSIINTLTLAQSPYRVDVEPFMNDGAKIIYQMKREDNSYSNTVAIDHEPFIKFPEAFYPTSKVQENITFYPIISFASDENYLFVIFNRWGQEVYRSTLPPVYGNYTEMQGRWDGTFKGVNCPPGIYAYQISYTYYGSKGKYSKSGSFMLVR